jgi:hypothetical protein
MPFRYAAGSFAGNARPSGVGAMGVLCQTHRSRKKLLSGTRQGVPDDNSETALGGKGDGAMTAKTSTQLVKYDAMCSAIAKAYRVDEVKNIRDKAMAFALYAKQAKNYDAERQAQEIRVRAERKSGQLLHELPKAKGGNPNLPNRSRVATGWSEPETLTKLGITKRQSSEWQRLAKVPDEEFEKAIADKSGMPSGRTIVRIGLHNAYVAEAEKAREKDEHVPSPPNAVRQLERSLKNQQEWSIEQACFFAFIKSTVGKKLIDRVSKAMPSPLNGMMACEKVNTMHSVLMEWLDGHWSIVLCSCGRGLKLPLPNVDRLVKDFAVELERRRELERKQATEGCPMETEQQTVEACPIVSGH